MNSQRRSLLFTSTGLIFVGCILISAAIPHASVETGNDEERPRSFIRQVRVFEEQDFTSLNPVKKVEVVEMAKDESGRAASDEFGDDTSESDAEMEEALKMELGDHYDADDEFDFMDNQEVDYASRMGFTEDDDPDDEYEEDEYHNDLDYSVRLKSDMRQHGRRTNSKVVASSSFAGIQNPRVIYPGDVFDGIFENTTYRRGGNRGDVIFEYVEDDGDGDDDDEWEDDSDDEDIEYDEDEDEEEDIAVHEEDEENYSNEEDNS